MATVCFLEKSPISGIKKRVLENGITVFLEELPEHKKVIFLVGIGVGTQEGTKKLYGIGHFDEHILYHSNRFRTAKEIVENVEYKGGGLYAGTDFDSAILYALGYRHSLSKNIRIIYEIVTNFEYRENEIEREREEILTEFRKAIDAPDEHYLDHLFIPVLLRKTHVEKPVLGTPKTVKHLTKEDLLTFKRKFFVPANIVIFVCGKFDEERVIKAIEKTFGRLKPQPFEQEMPRINLINRRRELFKKRKGIKLAYMALGYRVAGFNHSDSLKLTLIESILSNGMSSRLPQKLRSEKGIGYDELAGVYDDYGGIGVFYITIGGFNLRKFKEAKAAVLRELEDLKTNLVSKREFIRAKNIFLSNKDDEMEDLVERVEQLSDAYFKKSIFDPRNYKKYISKISREAIRRCAQKYFSDKYTLAALVPENFEK